MRSEDFTHILHTWQCPKRIELPKQKKSKIKANAISANTSHGEWGGACNKRCLQQHW